MVIKYKEEMKKHMILYPMSMEKAILKLCSDKNIEERIGHKPNRTRIFQLAMHEFLLRESKRLEDNKALRFDIEINEDNEEVTLNEKE